MRKNLQLTEPVLEANNDSSIEVVNIWKTLQGEGPFSGQRAVFIRMAGCNLQCPGCDTDYTSGRRRMTVQQIIDAVLLLQGSRGLIVLTGGEPLRQNVYPLMMRLLGMGSEVQIETNGTVFNDWLHKLNYGHFFIVCSPKTSHIRDELWVYIDAVKYVVQAAHIDSIDGLPTKSLGMGGVPARPPKDFTGEIYLSPLDEGNEVANALNRQAAVASCLKFGHRLSLQIHKLVGVE